MKNGMKTLRKAEGRVCGLKRDLRDMQSRISRAKLSEEDKNLHERNILITATHLLFIRRGDKLSINEMKDLYSKKRDTPQMP